MRDGLSYTIKPIEFGNKVNEEDGRVTVKAYLTQDFGEGQHMHDGVIDLRVIYDDSHKQLYINAANELKAFLTHALASLNDEIDKS